MVSIEEASELIRRRFPRMFSRVLVSGSLLLPSLFSSFPGSDQAVRAFPGPGGVGAPHWPALLHCSLLGASQLTSLISDMICFLSLFSCIQSTLISVCF